jgi:CSLREA domain-containing protein
MWGLVLAYASSPAWAAEITVNTPDDELNSDGDCSLREAIQAANTDASVDGCDAGSGPDTINLPSGTYLLSSQLDVTAGSTVTVDGGGATSTFIDGGNAVRLFFVASGAQLSLNELTLTKGHIGSNDGGAIRNQGTLVVTNSTFSGNTSNNQGGGIFSTGTLEVSNSTFSGNSSQSKGGAIGNRSTGTATVSNSTFSDNSALSGGAIANDLNLLAVTNSTFSGNSAAAGGGGIFKDFGAVTLKNTIVANSPAGGGCNVTITDGGGNLEWPDDTCGFATPSADPMLGPLADNGGPTQTHALGAGSAAIDAAVDCPPPATDQRGVRRPQGSACDIGAFELDQPLTVTINQASGQADPTTSSPISFTVVFNEPVSGFTDSDVTLSGTAGATTAVVTEIAPNDGTTYDVAVSGMTTDGTVIASIPANAAQDADQNGNTASTSTDNTVTFIANSAPKAENDSYSTNKDTPLSVAGPGVLANDTDPDGDTLSAVLDSGPDHGTLILNPDGSFTYTPNVNFIGSDFFTYKANDGSAESNVATVSITVRAPATKAVCKNGGWREFGYPDQGTCISDFNRRNR